MELFISYPRDEKQWVYELARELEEKQELTVWLDRDLAIGQHWWDEILKQIEECEYFMLILTPACVSSIYCLAELDYAYALGKPILPLLMKTCDKPSLLRTIQYYNIEGQTLSDVLQKCAVALRKAQADILTGKYSAPANKPPRPPLPGPNLQPPVDLFSVDDTNYRTWLRERTDAIDIRGIGAGNTRQAHRFPLLSLYMPLHARPSGNNSQRTSLEERVMTQLYTIVIGSPGSGKTTFLNYLSRRWVGLNGPLPLLMKASDIYEYVCKSDIRYHADLAWKWLIDYWLEQAVKYNWGFNHAWLSQQLQSGKVSLLLDSLDELPNYEARVKITQMIDGSVQRWPECRWIMTSRPNVLRDRAIPLEFIQTTIDLLSDSEIKRFVHTWVNLLFEKESLAVDGGLAQAYERELLATIRNRSYISILARNPVMLTSMVVVHWNEKKLPEGKADLYEAAIRWLLKVRDNSPSQFANPKSRQYLQSLALSMLRYPGGRRTTVGLRWAADQLASYFDGPTEQEKIEQALQFLDRGEIETGIIVRRDQGNVAFWHTSFQEYLAACEIASKTDDKKTGWWSIIESHLSNPDWKEVMRFVPVILHRLGDERVDLFIKRVLNSRADDTLPEITRVFGFLGLLLYDLSVYGYSVEHVDEYVQARHQVMRIFTIEGASQLDYQSRFQAAIALGSGGDGDPRFFKSEENWIVIPGGVAYIGAQKTDPLQPNYDELAEEAEQPVHLVYSAAFQIGRYPVTVQEYRRFVEDVGHGDRSYQGGLLTKSESKPPQHWDEQLPKPNCPVVYVSWHEACAYCNWLSDQDDQWNYRLPTEAEWEYMARRDQCSYSRYVIGNVSPMELANELIGNRDQAAPVGLFPRDATADGVFDINGNIHEWVYDPGPTRYTAEHTQASLFLEPEENSSVMYRYRRGGSWDDTARNHRTARRTCVLPGNCYDDTGFRVLRVRKPVRIKGTLPALRYPFTLADVYARHTNHTYSYEEANQHLQNYIAQFAVAINVEAILALLFPVSVKNRSFARLPCVLNDAPLSKLDFNLLYQDTRIKLGVEEKLGTSAKLEDYQRDARNLLEVIAILLSTNGLQRPFLWQDFTDNDLDGLICLVLNSYDPGRNQRLLKIGYETNRLALQNLGTALDTLDLSRLIAHQVFAGTVWWNQISDVEKERWPVVGRFEIDDRERFKQNVLVGDKHMTFLFDDNGELIWDLALIQFLLRHNSSLRVTGVISNQVMYNNANWVTLSTVLQEPIFQELAASSRFTLLREDNFRSSIDLNYCSETLMDAIRSSDFVFIKGVAGFETLQQLPVNTYYAFVVYSEDSQKTSGCKKGAGVFVRIPAGKAGYHYETTTLRDIYPKLNKSK